MRLKRATISLSFSWSFAKGKEQLYVSKGKKVKTRKKRRIEEEHCQEYW
jgi:hypothetical protein